MHSEKQERANYAVENYVRAMLGNTRDFKSVAFSELKKKRYATSLDTSLTYANIDTDNRRQAQKYVDSENGQRPDLAVSNVKDLYNIEHDKLTYYVLIYRFRIDSNGFKKYFRYRFELDTACNILNAKDITQTRSDSE